MSSHRRLVKHFGRKSNARKALLKGLMKSLIEHGRIKTTLLKAKETRRYIEKAITLGKKNDLNSTRVLAARFSDAGAAVKLVKEISPRFLERNGGYTRIIKLGLRPGDKAEMAFIEFVDFDWKAVADSTTVASKPSKATKTTKAAVEKGKKSEVKIASKAKKLAAENAWKSKKAIRKIQNASRAASFAK